MSSLMHGVRRFLSFISSSLVSFATRSLERSPRTGWDGKFGLTSQSFQHDLYVIGNLKDFEFLSRIGGKCHDKDLVCSIVGLSGHGQI